MTLAAASRLTLRRSYDTAAAAAPADPAGVG